jgi:hypothetical protein
VYAWLVGVPFLLLTVLRSEKYHFELLLLNVSKVQDSELIVQQC